MSSTSQDDQERDEDELHSPSEDAQAPESASKVDSVSLGKEWGENKTSVSFGE